MTGIIMDNWTIQNAASNIYDVIRGQARPNAEYIKLVESIVLWDKIYYVDNRFATYWKELLEEFGYGQYLFPLSELCDTDEEYKVYIEHAKYISMSIPGVIGRGATEYQAISDQMHIGYLPHTERMKYLSNQSRIYLTEDRRNIIEKFDDEVIDFYLGLNSNLKFDREDEINSLIFNRVRNKSINKYFIDEAMDLRDSEQARKFRKQMTAMEQDLSIGDRRILNRVLRDMRGILNNKTNPTNISLNMRVEWPMWTNMKMLISASTKIFYDRNKMRQPFLSELVDDYEWKIRK